jgi:hypothetical protein
MPERPHPPGGALLAWLAINAQLIGLVMLFDLRHVLALQITIPSLDAAGLAAILIFYLGRRREWSDLLPYVRDMERERDHRTSETSIKPVSRPVSRSSVGRRVA